MKVIKEHKNSDMLNSFEHGGLTYRMALRGKRWMIYTVTKDRYHGWHEVVKINDEDFEYPGITDNRKSPERYKTFKEACIVLNLKDTSK